MSSEQVLSALRVPAGLLDRAQLAHVAAAFAARTELWKPHLDLDADVRTFAELHRDDRVDVWALFWVPETDTGWHDHDLSSGAVHVAGGSLTEHALVLGGPERRRHYERGATFTFGPSHIHRVSCEVPRAVSIHAYSPPLSRLGQYSTSANGVLHREVVDSSHELRPQAVAL